MVELEEPDKGRAWVVAIAACIINMILSGLSRMIGLLYVSVIDAYGVTRQEATLPFTVRNAIRCLSGPIVGVVGQRYGIRAVTFCGGLIASAGAALCFVAPNTTWLAVFWGGMHGLGFAFANTLFQVVVNQYFRKHRATASGIALSGACIGSFVFPFMIEEILDTFGLSGGFLILGGVIMHVLPPSLLLKSPLWIEDPEKYAKLWALKNHESVETLDVIEEEAAEKEFDNVSIRDLMRSSSLSNCPVEEVGVSSVARRKKVCSGEERKVANIFSAPIGTPDQEGKTVVCTLYKITESPVTDRKDYTQNGVAVPTSDSKHKEIRTISGDIEGREKAEEASKATTSSEPASFKDNMKSICSLYTNPAYMLISICMSTYVVIFIPILTVLVDYGKDKGMLESDGKYLINAMAMGDLVGRLCFGWVTDKNYLSIPIFMMISNVLQGVFISLFPLAMSFYSYTILLSLYGVAAGAILVHFPLLVFKYVEIEIQSIAMGCVGLLSGIVSFGIPLLIGHFRDNVGSYDGMFYSTGIVSVVCGGLWLLEPVMIKIHDKNVQKKNDEKQGANNTSSK